VSEYVDMVIAKLRALGCNGRNGGDVYTVDEKTLREILDNQMPTQDAKGHPVDWGGYDPLTF
jgi:hypothetical protein